MSDPIRVEIDLPIVIMTQFGHVQLDNQRSLEDVIAHFFTVGDVISLHIVAESSGATRGFCQFERVAKDGYKSMCHMTLRETGECPNEADHEKNRKEQAERAKELVEAE